jgi:hypothetical protein
MGMWIAKHRLLASALVAGLTVAGTFGVFLYYLNSVLFLPSL